MAHSDNIVASWYNANVDFEDQRLNAGRLEYAVTIHTILDIIDEIRDRNNTKSLKIADVGCGTGRYAVELARRGHELFISDISSGEIDLANQKAANAEIKFHASSAFDARRLRDHPEIFKEDYYDLVLLLGPLYHVLELWEREDLLRNALATVHPGGFLVAAFVTRNAHLRDIAVRDPARLLAEGDFYAQYMKDGKYTRGSAAPMHHTTPKEIREFLRSTQMDRKSTAATFEVVKMVSCEGFLGFIHAASLCKLPDDEFEEWLKVILETASDEETLGSADHLLVVLRRTS